MLPKRVHYSNRKEKANINLKICICIQKLFQVLYNLCDFWIGACACCVCDCGCICVKMFYLLQNVQTGWSTKLWLIEPVYKSSVGDICLSSVVVVVVRITARWHILNILNTWKHHLFDKYYHHLHKLIVPEWTHPVSSTYQPIANGGISACPPSFWQITSINQSNRIYIPLFNND